MTDVLGWTSSLVLLATISAQIHKQWSERTVEGVSVWLFIGQCVASTGFTAYSILVRNWVFTVTNGLLALSAMLGLWLTLRFKRSQHGAR